MAYKPLSKLYHADRSAERERNAATELEARLNGPGTIRTGFQTPAGELFMVQTSELSTSFARIVKASAEIDALLLALPGIVQDRILRNLVLDEVVSSNEIEDIHSTRRQVRDAVERAKAARGSRSAVRFAEFALLYEDLLSGKAESPASPEDIRHVYDRVVLGELDPGDAPDGTLFRAHGVDVIGNGGRVLHRGIEPESEIVKALNRLLAFSRDPRVPGIYRSLIAHYFFEYVHPFYDGNGRTGRYLLSLWLMQDVSAPLALSISRILLERRSDYYRAIRTVEEPLNHAELTFYVASMADIMCEACDEMTDRLEQAAEVYLRSKAATDALALPDDVGKKERSAILVMLQFEIFGRYGTASVNEVAAYLGIGAQMARKYLGRLEKRGICERSRRYDPVTFRLTDEFLQDSGLGELRLE